MPRTNLAFSPLDPVNHRTVRERWGLGYLHHKSRADDARLLSAAFGSPVPEHDESHAA